MRNPKKEEICITVLDSRQHKRSPLDGQEHQNKIKRQKLRDDVVASFDDQTQNVFRSISAINKELMLLNYQCMYAD